MRFMSVLFGHDRLSALSHLDDRRLSDLGLTRYDLADARAARDAAGLLNSRRNERALTWLR